MRTRPKWFYVQSAVVPYRHTGDSLDVLLITSRRGKHWTIPKGVVERGMSAAESAAKEAYEEAGVRGSVGSSVLGAYEYEKWGGTCRVDVYPLRVDEVLVDWPESRSRQRQWVSTEEAVAAVDNEGLRRVLAALDGNVAR